MKQGLDKQFPAYTPDYILDEIDKYFWKRQNGNSGIATFNNILALIRLAFVNNRINGEQAKEIKDIISKFNIEK